MTFALTSTASGTHLCIVQSGFMPHQKRNLNGARYGWKIMCGNVLDVFRRTP